MTVDDVIQSLDAIGAKLAAALVQQQAAQITDLTRQVAVHQERLRQAMGRETELRTTIQQREADLAAAQSIATENQQLRATMARYDTHPEVRAAKRAALQAQAATLAAQAAALADPEPTPAPEPEPVADAPAEAPIKAE